MSSISTVLRVFGLAAAALSPGFSTPAAAAEPLLLTFQNLDTSYGSAADAWFQFSYTGSSASDFDGSVLGSGAMSGAMVFQEGAGPSAGSFFSQAFPISELADGVQLTKAPSTRVYVSLGQKLDAAAADETPDKPFSKFGVPSSTAGSADPNWNVRWDFFELTLSDPRSAQDYGDLSGINQFAIPLQIDLYSSASEQTLEYLLQSARSAPDPEALATQLLGLANANVANNNSPSLSGNWHVRTPKSPAADNPFPDTFLRQVGPASGGTQPEWIGPYPSMNHYASFVANEGSPISAPLKASGSVAGVQLQSFDMATSAWLSESDAVLGIKVSGTIETQTWNANPPTWNPATSNGKTYEMRIALDAAAGQQDAKYHLSNALYGSAWADNAGVSYWITEDEVTSSHTRSSFLAEVSSNATMALQTVNLWMQNLFVGYNFGLVGNPSTVSNLPGGHHLEGVTLNDMGSEGWAELKVQIDTGQISTADVPFFGLTDSMGRPLYNSWAKIVFEDSETIYGMQYSDMFQPLLALYTYESNFVHNVYQQDASDVLSWRVTILPMPEPAGAAAWAAVLATLLVLGRGRSRG